MRWVAIIAALLAPVGACKNRSHEDTQNAGAVETHEDTRNAGAAETYQVRDMNGADLSQQHNNSPQTKEKG